MTVEERASAESAAPNEDEEPSVMGQPHVVGYLCPERPEGPMIPPRALTDPCGKDVPVWSDGWLGARP